MAMQLKVSRAFRARLQTELATWQSEGLVTPDQARALSERYALANLPKEGSGLLLTAVYVIGVILIGGGIIAFVAAHWETIPRIAKVVMLS